MKTFMMRKNRLMIVLIVFFSMVSMDISAQVDPIEKGMKAINEDVIKAQLGFLASDWTEGREVGERGEYLAGDYIASMLQLYGVKPFGDIVSSGSMRSRSYFQNFVLLKTTIGEEQTLQLKTIEGKSIQTISFTNNIDFNVRTIEPAYEINAPVVFVGYGYRNDALRYNDFAKIDVKGKIVLKIHGLPKFAGERMNGTDIYNENKRMDSLLKSMGAVAVLEFLPELLVVTRPEAPEFLNISPAKNSPETGKPYATYSIPSDDFNSELRKIIVSAKVANEIMKESAINFNDYISKADNNQSFNITQPVNKEIFIKTSASTTQVPVRNILGIIEGKNPEQYIVLGAHYDHFGVWNGYVWTGADDNASGTTGIMTIAKAIAETGVKPEKSIIFAFWTAEEVGLLGSRYYLDNLTYPLNRIKLNLNFDMISRYITDNEPRSVTMTYTDKYHPMFRDITVANLRKYDINLMVDYQPSADPPGGSDHRSFTAKGIPVMRFKPGHRDEYHTPWDEISTVNWDIMEKIIKIGFANIWNLANSEW